ncbi:MAG: flagellar M-ring protein FliF C-terminal domain-containing protein, partial [Rhodothermales bacterium]|nr:flagellar M-ring protein FliF C-terminal domain-containing protein [Rhodothermales bacterium]
MLDRVLGPGRAVLRVSAALDFSRSVQERDAIDPESVTVISEERLEEQAAGDAASSTLRNYELSRVRERSEKGVGTVERLTVSVILDHKRPAVLPAAEDAEPPAPEPYTAAELREIEDLVKNAVGFDAERGDRFAIHQTRFDTSADDAVVAALEEQEDGERLDQYLRYGLILLALGLGAFLVRSATRQATELATGEVPRLEARPVEPVEGRHTAGELAARAGAPASGPALPPAAGEDGEVVLVDDYYTSKLSDEAKARLQAKHQMYEETRQNVIQRPEEAAELLRSWLAEDQAAA